MAKRDLHLRRRKAFRQPRARFVIFCEGANTEPEYFAALKAYLRSTFIEIETQHAGVPLTVAERAIQRGKQLGLIGKALKRRNSFEAMDQIWAVFDRDEHPNFAAAVNLCESNGIAVARSNPCFEVWLIQHIEEYHRPDDRHQVQRHLQALRPEYDPGGSKSCNCTALICEIENAEHRARKQQERREREGDRFARPSTTVWKLTAAIREAASKSSVREPSV